MNTSEFFKVIESEKDISKALRKYFNDFVTEKTSYQDAVPIILHRTHAVTMVSGVEKSISIVDLKSIISDLTNDMEETIPPISLPYGCFMFNKKGDYLYLNCYYKETIADIKYDPREGKKHEIFKVPLPNIILSFTLKRVENKLWQLDNATYLCSPKSVTQLTDTNIILGQDVRNGIHILPMSNIYSSGKMCFGGNTMPMRFNDNLRGLDYYYQILTLAPFNSDLGVNGLKQNFSPRNWYKHLSTLSSFPYDLLYTEK